MWDDCGVSENGAEWGSKITCEEEEGIITCRTHLQQHGIFKNRPRGRMTASGNVF